MRTSIKMIMGLGLVAVMGWWLWVREAHPATNPSAGTTRAEPRGSQTAEADASIRARIQSLPPELRAKVLAAWQEAHRFTKAEAEPNR